MNPNPPAKNPRVSWAWRMAWRDGRKSGGRFLLYISAVSLGIGALIAADSFRHNLQDALKQQAKPLLGADLVVGDRRPFDAAADVFFASLPYPRFKEIRLNTVAFVPKAGASRIVEVRAVETNFPFYGEVRTAPPGVLPRLFDGPQALVEESVQSGAGRGDPHRRRGICDCRGAGGGAGRGDRVGVRRAADLHRHACFGGHGAGKQGEPVAPPGAF
jgi:putative ABC transport system permease protein